MSTLAALSTEELRSALGAWEREYELLAGNRLALDLSRGKPGPDQLSLSDSMESAIGGDYRAQDGTDVRNYGGLRGLPEARELGAALLDAPPENVFALGNSSLNLMHLVVSTALETGLWGDDRRWSATEDAKILAPVPGYDRHFVLAESLGLKHVTVPMLDSGPDMAAVERIAAEDPSVKGIWCVPKYANPTGCIYDDTTVDALARLPSVAAASDFVVLWDNAYAVHDLYFPPESLRPIWASAQAAGTQDHVVQFASTSKITFAGAGLAFLSSGATVLDTLEQRLSYQMIGPDKVNQLRHCRFLDGRLEAHMQAHAKILRPKFDLVLRILREDLGELAIAEWTEPKGGYFISLDVEPGLAKRVIEMAHAVGLTLTPAGSTFPEQNDPDDRNVRIAPTFASLDDLEAAMRVLTLCVKLASARKALSK